MTLKYRKLVKELMRYWTVTKNHKIHRITFSRHMKWNNSIARKSIDRAL